MRFVKAILVSNWQSILKYAALFVLLGFVLFWQLGGHVPGFTAAEQTAFHQSGLRALIDNPLNLPYYLIVKAGVLLHGDSLIVTRVASALVGFVTLGFFCWLLYRWHGSRIAIIGTLLLGTSAWFVHVARMGTPDVLMFGIIALIACGFWLRQTRSIFSLVACSILAALLLYVPGMVWFIAAGIVWQWRTIDYIIKERLATTSVSLIGMLLLIAPLIWAFMHDQSLIMTWLGLPEIWPAPLEILTNIAKVPYHLAISNAPDAARWLGTAPIIDVFSVAMLGLGGILYLRKIMLLRTPLLLSLIIVGVLLIALNGQAAYSFIIPVLYLIITSGVGYLLDEWLGVFPRNPIARGVGYVLVGLVVATTCIYHVRHYFIGWPAARATTQIHNIQQP